MLANRSSATCLDHRAAAPQLGTALTTSLEGASAPLLDFPKRQALPSHHPPPLPVSCRRIALARDTHHGRSEHQERAQNTASCAPPALAAPNCVGAQPQRRVLSPDTQESRRP